MSAASEQDRTQARRRWMSVLAQASRQELEECWCMAGAREASRWIRPAETGLVMVRGRAGGGGIRFNLGEMTATRCACRIEGSDAIGYALTAGRDKRKAELASLLDAVLQSAPDCATLAEELLEPLRRSREERRRAEAAKAAATRVDFFTMVRGE